MYGLTDIRRIDIGLLILSWERVRESLKLAVRLAIANGIVIKGRKDVAGWRLYFSFNWNFGGGWPANLVSHYFPQFVKANAIILPSNFIRPLQSKSLPTRDKSHLSFYFTCFNPHSLISRFFYYYRNRGNNLRSSQQSLWKILSSWL